MAGIRLEFAQFGHFDSFDIIRSTTSMVGIADADLPTPIVTSLKTMYYVDTNVVKGTIYYYKVRVWRGSISFVSNEVLGETGDKYWHKVKVLMHFNASSGSTTSFYEEKNQVFLPRLGSTYVEAGGRFDDGVFFGRANARAIQIPASFFKLDDVDFTFDISLKFTQLNTNTFYDICGQRGNYSSNQSYAFYYYTGNGKFHFEFSSNGTTMDYVTFDYIPIINQYHDYQLKRSGNALILEVDGTEVGRANLPPGFTFFESTAQHQIALSAEHVAAATQTHPTWFDEFRVTIGIAREIKTITTEFYNF